MVKNKGKSTHKFNCKRFLATFLVLTILMLTSISFVSAFEFDNVKSYNQETKTMTINNCDFWAGLCLNKGEEIAEAKLITPQSVGVNLNGDCLGGFGKDCLVAEVEINNAEIYSKAIKKIEFFELDKKTEKEKDYLIRYKVHTGFEKVLTNCIGTGTYEKNGTEIKKCEEIEGKEIYEWEILNVSEELPKGISTIGIYTDVGLGETGEWIPTLFGIKINEWANYYGINDQFYTLDYTGGGGSYGNPCGLRFNVTSYNMTLFNGTFDSITTGTMLLRDYADTTTLASGSVSAKGDGNGIATFNYDLEYGVSYFLKMDAYAGQYFDSLQGFPYDSGNVTWLDGLNPTTGSFDTGNAYCALGITVGFLRDSNPTITLNSPKNNTLQTNNTVFFNCSAESKNIIEKTVLYIDGVLNETFINGTDNSTNIFVERTLSPENHEWNCMAEDNSTIPLTAWGENNFTILIDLTFPKITLNEPSTTINYGYINKSQTLNWSIQEQVLDSAWYNYNGTNITVYGKENATTFTLESYANRNLTFYANDSSGNLNSTFIEWDYRIWENSKTSNASSYETAYESYSINVTANSSLTAVDLIYNGTSYATTGSEGLWAYGRDLATTDVGNNSIAYNFTYAGDTLTSGIISYQNVEAISFEQCDNVTTPYLNISFKDEGNGSYISASIPTSTFEYYLGTGGETKTLTYINSTAANFFGFCFTPIDRTINVDSYMQYKQGTTYPQRIWDPDTVSYTNQTTNQTLYLLNSVDGIYVTFQIVTSADQLISGVDITAEREIGGVDTIVATGTTGADGTATFWLNPDFLHTFTFVKSGYTTYETSLIPTQTAYTITLGGGTTQTAQDYTKGISYKINPKIGSLNNDTTYSFNYTLNSTLWDITEFGFTLLLRDGTVLQTTSSSSNGGFLGLNQDTENHTRIIMNYYYITNSSYVNQTTYWNIFNTADTQWSIAQLVGDFKSYMAVGIFGLDDFGRYIIVFLILFFTVGILGYKYGANSPTMVMGIIFSVVFFLDVVFELLPSPVGAVPHSLTFISFLLLVLLIYREAQT